MTMLPPLKNWLYVVRHLLAHFRSFWWAYVWCAIGYAWLQAHYRLGLSMSESLPSSVFLIVLGDTPSKVGDYIAFEWQRDQFYTPDWIFVKRVAGIGGQKVIVEGRSVFVDGKAVGYAKVRSRKGVPLEAIEPSVIPDGYFYAAAPHPDSLDSRYKVTGFIGPGRIIGKAYAIF